MDESTHTEGIAFVLGYLARLKDFSKAVEEREGMCAGIKVDVHGVVDLIAQHDAIAKPAIHALFARIGRNVSDNVGIPESSSHLDFFLIRARLIGAISIPLICLKL